MKNIAPPKESRSRTPKRTAFLRVVLAVTPLFGVTASSEERLPTSSRSVLYRAGPETVRPARIESQNSPMYTNPEMKQVRAEVPRERRTLMWDRGEKLIALKAAKEDARAASTIQVPITEPADDAAKTAAVQMPAAPIEAQSKQEEKPAIRKPAMLRLAGKPRIQWSSSGPRLFVDVRNNGTGEAHGVRIAVDVPGMKREKAPGPQVIRKARNETFSVMLAKNVRITAPEKLMVHLDCSTCEKSVVMDGREFAKGR